MLCYAIMNEPAKSFTLSRAEPAPVTRLELVLKNIVALILTPGFAYFGLLMGVFASDSGPNPISYLTVGTAYAVVPAAIICIIVSQLRRSRKWANAPFIIMFAPIIVLFGFAIIF